MRKYFEKDTSLTLSISLPGMMITAMARAGAVLGEEKYTQRALEAGNFIKTQLYKDGKLLRAAYASQGGGVSL